MVKWHQPPAAYTLKRLNWQDFPDLQNNVWAQLSNHTTFFSKRAFPSQPQLDYVKSQIKRISSEMGLRHFVRETVENMVSTLVKYVSEAEILGKAARH
jgi:hypothetical protein